MQKQIPKTFLFLVAFFMLPNFVLAAPSISIISGTISHDATITVNGSGFGAKAPATPVSFKNFEDGIRDSLGWAVYPDFVGNFTVSSNNNRTNSAYYGKAFYGAVNDERVWFQRYISGSPTSIYTSFWFRLGTIADQQSGKFYRLYFGPGGEDNFYLSTGGGDLQLRGSSECNGSTEWGAGNITENGWSKIEVLATNTKVDIWIDGTLMTEKTNWTAGGNCNWSPNGHSLDIPNMIDAPDRGWPANGEYSYDDIYVDYTLARVEICNANTKSTSSHCEIQIPQNTWTDNGQPNGAQLQIKVNQGSLSDGSAYLYVVDVNGSVSDQDINTAGEQGFPISFDLSSDTTAPSAPSGLSVQ